MKKLFIITCISVLTPNLQAGLVFSRPVETGLTVATVAGLTYYSLHSNNQGTPNITARTVTPIEIQVQSPEELAAQAETEREEDFFQSFNEGLEALTKNHDNEIEMVKEYKRIDFETLSILRKSVKEIIDCTKNIDFKKPCPNNDERKYFVSCLEQRIESWISKEKKVFKPFLPKADISELAKRLGATKDEAIRLQLLSKQDEEYEYDSVEECFRYLLGDSNNEEFNTPEFAKKMAEASADNESLRQKALELKRSLIIVLTETIKESLTESERNSSEE
jgi:hypothetical protein